MSPASERWPLGESNPDALRHKILSLACLPISPSGLWRGILLNSPSVRESHAPIPDNMVRVKREPLDCSHATVDELPHSVAKSPVLVARSVHRLVRRSNVDQWLT
jgi:hypothetical protein